GQSVAKDWERWLGVRTNLEQKEVKVFRDDLKNANYMTSRAGWYGDYGDPTTFLDLSRTGNGNNDRKFSSPEYDALLDRAADETDAAKRLAILQEAERMIMEVELPKVPIFHYGHMYMFDPNRLSGINPHPRTNQNLHLVDVLGDGIGDEEPMRVRLETTVTADAAGSNR
ncbi:MAG: hypothetical protein AAF747_04885, partial [Planctomycetota bacterium]